MALKNQKIAQAKNPLGTANRAYINALYQEALGRKANAKELAKFSNRSVKDAANLILGKNSPFIGWKPPVKTNTTLTDNTNTTLTDNTNTTPTNQQPDLSTQIANLLKPTQPVPPTFEQSGLYNEADVNAQAQREYNPYFSNALTELVKGYDRKNQDLQQAQQQQTGNQFSDYLNRGLSRSGGFIGAQQQLGQQQGLATQDLTNQKTQEQNELAQKKALALEDYRRNAYTRAYNQYLSTNYK